MVGPFNMNVTFWDIKQEFSM